MEQVFEQVIRHAQQRRFGKYRAFVVDNEDPETRGRLRLRIPSVLGDTETTWALPCLPFGGAGYGLHLLPEVDAEVWAEFEEGEISRPIWTGAFFTSAPGEEMTGPALRVLRTPGAHIVVLDDTEDAPRIEIRHAGGACIVLDDKGSVTVTDQAGARVVLDAEAPQVTVEDTNGNSVTLAQAGVTVSDGSGNTIETRSSGVTVKAQMVTVDATQVALGGAGGEPVIKGTSFLSAYMAHVHPTAWGPSGPPVPTTESSALSTKVTSS
jgi:uncharacterized protein involved in type VI secretion and phage assembly